MRTFHRFITCAAVLLTAALSLQAQPEITLEDIYVKGTFRARGVPQPTWTEDGRSYSALTGKGLVQVDAATLAEKVVVPMSAFVPEGADRPVIPEGYTWSDDKSKLLGIMQSYKDDFDFSAVVPVSALCKDGFAELQEEIIRHLPEGPSMFPEDELTDQPMRVIAAEMIREKVLRYTHDEVPHAIAVEINEFKERPNGTVFIRATIFVERESQKGIVIGARGSLLKRIELEARQDIENLTGGGVFLDLWVKVQADWRNKSKMLKEFGYKER